LANRGYKLGRGTIRRILQNHGIEPAPERGKGMPWSVFLKAHWKALAVSDFFTLEVWSWPGLVTYYSKCSSSWNWRRGGLRRRHHQASGHALDVADSSPMESMKFSSIRDTSSWTETRSTAKRSETS
jgi:hypothetical protein